ncbi:hypothetical protein Cfor_03654 [Coptotermes formosanus]|uniref:Prokineticin domain-containing protein n=1 Tax=Coptotermes formosanus TaxID=36987 RepID=A0A6L2PNK6_COPFO|nr:hypothetical protein Cfor_03654 [Coptotermes formosanus]
MLQLESLCAALLVLSLGTSLLEGARMHCDNNTECPEDHCCLQVEDDFVCTQLQTVGEVCQLDAGQDTTDNPADHQQNARVALCPCAAGLTCSSADSGSHESDVSTSSGSVGVCKAAEEKTEEGEPAE